MRKLTTAFALCSCLLLSGGATAFAAGDSEAALIATAHKAEDELTQTIEKSAAAFVFIGGGSGVLVSQDGYILTNHHVAGDRKQWTVRIECTGALSVCDLIGADPVGDLALLKVRDGHDLPFVQFGDIGTVKVGQQVLAVGDPFKLADLDGPPSVSMGTISALHRFQGNYCDAIQTDSAVNPGNSGGPLVTLDGKLIGITGQIMSRFGAKANTGIGYAIPIDQIQRFYPLLKEAGGGIVYHGTLPDGLTWSNHLDENQTATIQNVDAGSDAERAGFLAGDRIMTADGKRVYNFSRLKGIVGSYPENAALELVLERAGKPQKLKLVLPRMQLAPGPAYIGAIGAHVEQTSEGLKIIALDHAGPAERAGLLAGDTIVRVDTRPPNLDFSEFIGGKKAGDALSIQYRRSGPEGVSTRVVSVSPDIRK